MDAALLRCANLLHCGGVGCCVAPTPHPDAARAFAWGGFVSRGVRGGGDASPRVWFVLSRGVSSCRVGCWVAATPHPDEARAFAWGEFAPGGPVGGGRASPRRGPCVRVGWVRVGWGAGWRRRLTPSVTGRGRAGPSARAGQAGAGPVLPRSTTSGVRRTEDAASVPASAAVIACQARAPRSAAGTDAVVRGGDV